MLFRSGFAAPFENSRHRLRRVRDQSWKDRQDRERNSTHRRPDERTTLKINGNGRALPGPSDAHVGNQHPNPSSLDQKSETSGQQDNFRQIVSGACDASDIQNCGTDARAFCSFWIFNCCSYSRAGGRSRRMIISPRDHRIAPSVRRHIF